jgi:hypothetical protein
LLDPRLRGDDEIKSSQASPRSSGAPMLAHEVADIYPRFATRFLG